MKKVAKILSIILAIVLMLQLEAVALAATTKSKYTGYTYTHQEKQKDKALINGIDVSEHNGEIDFNKVKKSGIDFVFVRVGYTGYTKSHHSLNYDKYYKRNIEDAIKAGLKVGVYWYSQALTKSEATAEANMTLNAIKGYNLTMPVVFDYEFAGTSNGRLDSARLSKTTMTNNSLAFLDTIQKAGYTPCIYASKNFYEVHLNATSIESKYKVWLAHYTTSTNYAGDYEFWQYSSNGSVSGIGGRVDMNFWYNDGIEALPDKGYTGNVIYNNPTIIENGVTLTRKVDYKLTYEDNIQPGIAHVTATGIGDYEGKVWEYTFRILPKRPESLTVTRKTDTSLKCTWSKVDIATKYIVYVQNVARGTDFYVYSDTNSAEITNLTAGNTYRIRVCSVALDKNKNDVVGNYCASIKSSTFGEVTTGHKASSIKATSLKLSWNADKGADGYNIYKYNEKTNAYELIGTSKTNSYTVKGLKGGTTYKFKIGATYDGRLWKKGNRYVTATAPYQAELKSVSSPSKQKITVKWKKRTGSGYQIEWSTAKDFSSNYKRQLVSGSDIGSKTIKTAQSKKRYYVRVRAYKTVNGARIYGAWSDKMSIVTK